MSLHRDHSQIQGLFSRTDFPRSSIGFPTGCISGATSRLARLLCNRAGHFPLYRGASREGSNPTVQKQQFSVLSFLHSPTLTPRRHGSPRPCRAPVAFPAAVGTPENTTETGPHPLPTGTPTRLCHHLHAQVQVEILQLSVPTPAPTSPALSCMCQAHEGLFQVFHHASGWGCDHFCFNILLPPGIFFASKGVK